MLKGSDDGVLTHKIIGFLDFFHRPVIQRIENTTFQKLDLSLSSGKGGRRHLRRETDPVSKISCFLFSKTPDNGKSKKKKKNSNSERKTVFAFP
jgi:hypothetical protein